MPPDMMTQDQTNERRRRGRSNLTWILVVGAFLAVIAAPTMIILIFGLLPTVVAYIIDRSKQKSAAFSVFSINFIGVFPYVMDLWTDRNTVDAALTTVTDLFSMLVMYSAAAFGWLLFISMPPVIASFVTVMQQRKVAQLRAEQKDLIDEWGPDVAALVEMQRTDAKVQHLEEGMGGLAFDDD